MIALSPLLGYVRMEVCTLRLPQHPLPGDYIVATNREDPLELSWNADVGYPPVCPKVRGAYIY